MANQFTKGTRKAHDESTKDKIRAEQLSKRLEKYAKAKGKGIDKYRMEPAQVAAAKVLIERGKPALQAVEQTIINPMDQMSEEEVREMAKALITSQTSVVFGLLDADQSFREAVLAHISRTATTQQPSLDPSQPNDGATQH
jgi:hypothetical protein